MLDYPESAPRPAPTLERRAVAWIERGQRVLAVRAPASAARWAGMWQFPDVELAGTRAAQAVLARSLEQTIGLSVQVGERVLGLRHQVTRFRIELEVFGCSATGGRPRAVAYDEVRWTPVDELSTLPMPAAHRKIARSLASP